MCSQIYSVLIMLIDMIKIGVLRLVKKLESFKQGLQTLPESAVFVSSKLQHLKILYFNFIF